jgi:hypothetical protein
MMFVLCGMGPRALNIPHRAALGDLHAFSILVNPVVAIK